jgi:hypothetical protein
LIKKVLPGLVVFLKLSARLQRIIGHHSVAAFRPLG